jgi:hypothetical protein
MTLAPIVLFAYNRPWHIHQTITALKNNQLALDSELFIFSDAPKNDAARAGVQEVRQYLRTIEGFKRVTVICHKHNQGLAWNIINGVTEIVERYGRVIVLEDDLITSPYFLRFMNEGLDRYEHEPSVISIHGYIYPVSGELPETFFLCGSDCWGWATWQRGWALFEADGQKLLQELCARKLTKAFDFNGSYPCTNMLKRQIAKKNDSWAVRWYASAFLKEKLTLYPGKALVHNIGLDGSGIHCHSTQDFRDSVTDSPVNIRTIPIEEDRLARVKIEYFFRKIQPSFLTIIKRKLHKLLYARPL